MAIEKIGVYRKWLEPVPKGKMVSQFRSQSGRERDDIVGLQDGTVLEKFLRHERRLKGTHQNCRNVYV